MDSAEDNYNILLVEDETNLGNTLLDYLNAKGYQCFWADTATKARQNFYDPKVDPAIVLMDIGLPDGDGLTLAKEFRACKKDFVLLFLSALNDPNTRLEGLEIGAEDYITKPFALKELILRLERILSTQKSFNQTPLLIVHGALKIWFKRYEVQDGQGNLIPLSQKECAILKLLYQKKNQVVSRDEILENIWGPNCFPSNRTVDNYIVKLRKWCDTDPERTLDITSVRGIGYKLMVKA